MFKPLPGGKIIDIQGLSCALPPVGYVWNILTKKLEQRDIISRSHIPKEQYWERKEIPEWYKNAIKIVERFRRSNPDYSDPRCVEYEKTEWDRRLNGCWVMMNGKPVYLTGMHYMYLQWWKIDIGYPKYRQPNLEYFYFLQYCIEDPNCMGMIEVTKRREGKSYRAGLAGFEYTSRMEESQTGIQSKTGGDAKKFFGKAVVTPFRRLPKFFRPTYDQAGGIVPKSELRFRQTNIRGKRSESVNYMDELESLIDFASSEITGYDGQKLHRYISDEAGKTVEINIQDRHEVIRYCLLDDEGKIIGKALYTTTVEKLDSDKEGITDAFKELWNDSDQQNRKESGRTASGLYRFFTSAKKTRNFDKYGVPNERLTEQQILQERKDVEHDPKKLAARIRKEPLTIEEAFRIDADNCMFNEAKLHEQEDYLSYNKDICERGNFEWANGMRDTKVIWVPNRNGRWEIPKGWKFNKDETNRVERIGSQWKPLNNFRFGSGVDPYDHDVVADQRKRSMAASFVKQKNNIGDFSDPFIGTYVCKYHARPATAPLMYEDILKQCVFFGCSILFENNKPGIKRYFQDRGYGAFLMYLPGIPDAGVPASPANKEIACDFMEAMVENNYDKIVFLSLILDLLKFDINKTRQYDEAMAALWTELACQNKLYNQPDDNTDFEEVDEIFPQYEIAV